ncbi:MAG: F0F1 ATP synthase subunit B [Bacillota bacterium]|nr:F0F1 ATP synthase subunit B [Bacillota bacterium]
MPQFNIWTFLFQIINVLVVAAILYKIMYQPVTEIMHRREKHIEDSLAQADSAKAEAQALLEKYQKLMAQAREEAQSIVNQATTQAEEAKNQILARAEEEAKQILQEAKEEIQREKARAVAEVRNEVAEIALLAASKLIGRVLTPQDHERLARECVDEVSRLAN